MACLFRGSYGFILSHQRGQVETPPTFRICSPAMDTRPSCLQSTVWVLLKQLCFKQQLVVASSPPQRIFTGASTSPRFSREGGRKES